LTGFVPAPAFGPAGWDLAGFGVTAVLTALAGTGKAPFADFADVRMGSVLADGLLTGTSSRCGNTVLERLPGVVGTVQNGCFSRADHCNRAELAPIRDPLKARGL
jgi:hypothetical protein